MDSRAIAWGNGELNLNGLDRLSHGGCWSGKSLKKLREVMHERRFGVEAIIDRLRIPAGANQLLRPKLLELLRNRGRRYSKNVRQIVHANLSVAPEEIENAHSRIISRGIHHRRQTVQFVVTADFRTKGVNQVSAHA